MGPPEAPPRTGAFRCAPPAPLGGTRIETACPAPAFSPFCAFPDQVNGYGGKPLHPYELWRRPDCGRLPGRQMCRCIPASACQDRRIPARASGPLREDAVFPQILWFNPSALIMADYREGSRK